MFDAKAFIDSEFGGPRPLFEALLDYDPKLTINAVYKWRHRNSLPGDVLAVCLHILESRKGFPLSVTTYLAGSASCPSALPEKPTFTGEPPDIFG